MSADDPQAWPPEPRPIWRGISHLAAAVTMLVAGPALWLAAMPGTARLGALVFSVGVTLLFGISALYHRGDWGPEGLGRMRRVDHGMIFIGIASIYTPFCLVALPGPAGQGLLAASWVGAALGVLRVLAWPYAPRPVAVGTYAITSGLAIPLLPSILTAIAPGHATFLFLGAFLAGVGGLVYGSGRPRLSPRVFGNHELFHLLIVAMAVCYYVVVWGLLTARH